ncbi:MAG: hypothetical protein OEZ01_10595 [Candidatus Heimdallarchaeota archaeon]|nr:hypothetical protein [Candidatus Heimdallarchaeota archaeon]
MKLKFTHRNSSSNLTGFNTLEVEKIVNELKEKSHKKGYSVIFVKNGNYEDISEITFDAFAKMRQDIWNDMPREDGTWEDEIYDKDVHQGIYKQVEFGYESWMFLAIHEETGDIAGITETWFNPDLPQFAFQDDTGVVKQHRGNGLGLMLKYLMLSKMLSHDRRKDLVYWTTGNADSNEHMLKINDVLKYKPEYYELIYEISRDEFSNLLS